MFSGLKLDVPVEVAQMKRTNNTAGGVSIQVKGKGLTVNDAVHEQVVHKMQRLDKYLDRLQRIEVELAHENVRDSGQQNQVQAVAHVPGRTLRVATVNADLYAAIDEAVDKLYRQLNRTKERMKSHKAAKILPPMTDAEMAAETPLDSEREPIIHVERLDVEPMFEDEAIQEMEEQRRSFYVFLNARNERVNVLYRRQDGSYALIEPRAG